MIRQFASRGLRQSRYTWKRVIQNSNVDDTRILAPTATRTFSNYTDQLKGNAKKILQHGTNAASEALKQTAKAAKVAVESNAKEATSKLTKEATKLYDKGSEGATKAYQRGSTAVSDAIESGSSAAATGVRTAAEAASKASSRVVSQTGEAISSTSKAAADVSYNALSKTGQALNDSSRAVAGAASQRIRNSSFGVFTRFQEFGERALRWFFWWSLAAIAVYGMATTVPTALIRYGLFGQKSSEKKESTEQRQSEPIPTKTDENTPAFSWPWSRS